MNRVDPSIEQQTLTHQEALGRALEHHTAGRLPEAENIYQQILQTKPNHPYALHLLGVISHQEGKHDRAIDLIAKALSVKPDFAEAHSNLGLAQQELGRLEEAVASFHKAVNIKPDYAEAYNNLGFAQQELGRLEEAVVIYQKALDIKSDYAKAYYNLGNAEFELRKLGRAVASYNKALTIKPDYAEAHYNLGNLLLHLGKLDEAEESYLRALESRAYFPDAITSYGILLIALDRWNEALELFHRNLEMVRGNKIVDPNLDSFRFITKAKMKHDIEQFRYLEGLNSDSEDISKLVRLYETLDKEVKWPDGDGIVVPLNDDQLEQIRSSYNRPLFLIKAPELHGSALNRDLDVKSITRDYMDNAPGMTYFDDFLMPEVINTFRRFLLESTIWYDFNYSAGYLGAMLADGLACPLLFQISRDLRQAFPEIFKNYQLTQSWAYKYDSRLTGINLHADAAAVNVNFWITPDSANLNPNNGGLVVYKAEAPMDWNFKQYNARTECDQIRAREFLAEHNSEKMVVPYRENRIVLFNSSLFHETDMFEFKQGYENRRINVTLLFGSRYV